MDIIQLWTKEFLNGIHNSNPTRSSEKIKTSSVAFGRTTRERLNTSTVPTRNKFRGRERVLSSMLYIGKRHTVDEPAKETFDSQKGKIHGRQIMNSHHDQRKAQEIRTRQKLYSIQVHNSRRNTASLNIDSITRVVVQGFKNLIDCERCALFLMDHKTNELYFKPLGDEHDANCGEIRFPVTAGVAGYCATSRTKLNIKNAYQDPRFNSDIDKQTNFRTRTILCMPVLSSVDTVLGVIQMINKKKGDIKKILSDAKKKKSDSNFHGYESGYKEFSKEDEDILEKCCREVSIVLEPILKSSGAHVVEEYNQAPKEKTDSERRPSTLSRRDSRRVSVGSLVQFVNCNCDQNVNGGQVPLNEVDISVTEAVSRYRFRSASGLPANGADDPNRAVAATRRKRMIEYGVNTRRRSISSLNIMRLTNGNDKLDYSTVG